MKRRAIFVFVVFVLAATASAGLQLDVINGKAIISGNLESDFWVILTAGNGASLSDFALGPDAPLASLHDPQITVDFFRNIGGPIPDGFEGEVWVLASFPGEAYKPGTYLTAEVTLTPVQETATWQEFVIGPCPNGWPILRTWTEVTTIQTGSLSLVTYDEITGKFTTVNEWTANEKSVTRTFVDSMCPEPATLVLFGLGMVLIRRRSTIE